MTDVVIWEEAGRIRDWLLAILRFAVTLEPADRAAILAIAQQMDRLGSGGAQSSFAFFVRASTEICDGIVVPKSADKITALHGHLEKIEDDRLRRALEAILEIQRPAIKPGKSRKPHHQDLWKGLAGERASGGSKIY